jgi:hypothetical protein
MQSSTQQSDLKKPELPQPPAPYVKPAVERIPLSEATSGTGAVTQNDLQTNSS